MAKRASLPGASELFRPTDAEAGAAKPRRQAARPTTSDADRPPSPTGRVKHDHKITVYFSEEELLALEDANLDLRRNHSIRVDRGRLVRTAVAVVLRDLHARGDDAVIVQELRD